jgi:hypothetical protein
LAALIISPLSANTINAIPESPLYHAKLIAEGYTFDLEDNCEAIPVCPLWKVYMNHLAHTQTEENFKSMQNYYFPCIHIVKRVGYPVLSLREHVSGFIWISTRGEARWKGMNGCRSEYIYKKSVVVAMYNMEALVQNPSTRGDWQP